MKIPARPACLLPFGRSAYGGHRINDVSRGYWVPEAYLVMDEAFCAAMRAAGAVLSGSCVTRPEIVR